MQCSLEKCFLPRLTGNDKFRYVTVRNETSNHWSLEMNINTVKLAFFSPTGTTRAVALAIAGSIADRLECIDITTPDARVRPLLMNENELLIMAVPVYMGRVPALLGEWFGTLQGRGTPAVCVVVYGNRAYENALLELRDTVANCGCVPIAGGAFIGEHSFAHPDRPTAMGRPDRDDLDQAKRFGQDIREKLQTVVEASGLPELQVPGTLPYGGVTKLWDVDFIAVSDQCTQCGLCAAVCPVGAIAPNDSSFIDHGKCITCCACIKKCPQGARGMKSGPVMDASIRLNTLYREPRQPECFL